MKPLLKYWHKGFTPVTFYQSVFCDQVRLSPPNVSLLNPNQNVVVEITLDR